MPRRRPRSTHTIGRPLALTPEKRKKFLDAVTMGTPLNLAAEHAGFATSAYREWIIRGEAAQVAIDAGEPVSDNDRILADFAAEATLARANGGVRNVLLVQKVAAGGFVTKRRTRTYLDAVTKKPVTEVEEDIAPPDWRASAWILERTHRKHFGRDADRVEVSGPGGGAVQIESGDIDGLAARLLLNIAAAREDRSELTDGDGSTVIDGVVVDTTGRSAE